VDTVNAITSATSGMHAAQLRMDMAAAVLAKVASIAPPSASVGAGGAGGAGGASTGSEPDVAMALVDQMLALSSFGLNASAARSADDLTAETLKLADGFAGE
jgi:hypothetical protein